MKKPNELEVTDKTLAEWHPSVISAPQRDAKLSKQVLNNDDDRYILLGIAENQDPADIYAKIVKSKNYPYDQRQFNRRFTMLKNNFAKELENRFSLKDRIEILKARKENIERQKAMRLFGLER